MFEKVGQAAEQVATNVCGASPSAGSAVGRWPEWWFPELQGEAVKRSRHDGLLALRLGLLRSHPGQEASDERFYAHAAPTPDRTAARPVRRGRRAGLRRRPARPARRGRAARGGGLLAGDSVHAGPAPVGLARPGGRPRRLLPRRRRPGPGLARRPRPAPLPADRRPVLQGPGPPARVTAPAAGAGGRPRPARPGRGRLAVAG